MYAFRNKGVVPAPVFASAMGLAIAWWYARRIELKTPSPPKAEVQRETSALLGLGVVLMANGLMILGSVYAIRMLVARYIDLEATGLEQSAWALGGFYLGLILQSMGADFYPRLTAIANDDAATKRAVKEQARVSLLMAAPGALATLTFAPLVIAVFFARASLLARFSCCACCASGWRCASSVGRWGTSFSRRATQGRSLRPTFCGPSFTSDLPRYVSMSSV